MRSGGREEEKGTTLTRHYHQICIRRITIRKIHRILLRILSCIVIRVSNPPFVFLVHHVSPTFRIFDTRQVPPLPRPREDRSWHRRRPTYARTRRPPIQAKRWDVSRLPTPTFPLALADRALSLRPPPAHTPTVFGKNRRSDPVSHPKKTSAVSAPPAPIPSAPPSQEPTVPAHLHRKRITPSLRRLEEGGRRKRR